MSKKYHTNNLIPMFRLKTIRDGDTAPNGLTVSATILMNLECANETRRNHSWMRVALGAKCTGSAR